MTSLRSHMVCDRTRAENKAHFVIIPGASQVALAVKNKKTTCRCMRRKRCGSIPGSGRSLGGGHGNPLHYSCLEIFMNRGAGWAIVHGFTKSQTWLSDLAHMLSFNYNLVSQFPSLLPYKNNISWGFWKHMECPTLVLQLLFLLRLKIGNDTELMFPPVLFGNKINISCL